MRRLLFGTSSDTSRIRILKYLWFSKYARYDKGLEFWDLLFLSESTIASTRLLEGALSANLRSLVLFYSSRN